MADKKFNVDIETTQTGSGAKDTMADIDGISEATESGIDHLESLAAATERFNESVAAGNQEEAIEAFEELKASMDALAESADAIPSELEDINEGLDDLEKKVRGKSSFDKLTEDSNKAEKSLSKLEKLEVAEALSQIVSDARSAGEGFVELGNDALSGGEKALTGAQAVGDAASSIGAGFAAGGPIGAGIALLSVALSFFTANAKKSKQEITDALGEGIEESFKRSKDSIDSATEALELFTKQQSISQANLNEEISQIQSIVDLELIRARNNAELNNLDRELKKVKILGDDSLSEEDKEKALAALEVERIKEEAQLKKDEIKAQLAAEQEKIDKLDESRREKIAQRDQLLDQRNPEEIEEEINSKSKVRKNIGKDFNVGYAGLDDLIDDALFFGELSDDENEKPIRERLKAYKDSDDKSESARGELINDILDLVNNVPDSQLDGDGKDLKDRLEELANQVRDLESLDKGINALADNKQQSEEKIKALEESIERLFKEGNDQRVNLFNEKEKAKLEQEKIDAVKDKKVEINTTTTDNKVNQIEKREAQKAKQESEKKQKEIERQQKKEDAEINKAATIATGVATDDKIGLNSNQINYVKKAQASLGDGVDLGEVKQLQKIVIDLANQVLETQGGNSAEFEKMRQANKMLSGKVKLIEQRAKANRSKS